jgi:hypothetical protein
MVDDDVPVHIEPGGENLLGDRHADGIGDPLAQWAGGDLDAGREAAFGMASTTGTDLPEGADVV